MFILACNNPKLIAVVWERGSDWTGYSMKPVKGNVACGLIWWVQCQTHGNRCLRTCDRFLTIKVLGAYLHYVDPSWTVETFVAAKWVTKSQNDKAKIKTNLTGEHN